MLETVEQLKEQLSALPVADRAELAHFLLQTLDNGAEAVDAQFLAELDRRRSEMESGKVKGVPAEVFLARLRAKYP